MIYFIFLASLALVTCYLACYWRNMTGFPLRNCSFFFVSFALWVRTSVVWQADYDIYGNLRNLHSSRRFIPFRQLGQYEDEETGQYYNRFRYFDPNTETYISQDPIGLAGNNPTLYGYVGDCNKWFDLFGLDYFYQLIKHDKVVYNGIIKNPVKDRIADHIGVKDFT